MKNLNFLIALVITIFIELFVLSYVKKHSYENNKQLIKAFMSTILCMVGWALGLIIQLFVVNFISEDRAQYTDYLFVYPFIIFMPIALFFFAYTFKNKKITFKRWFLLLFIVPTITVFVALTNDFHHLFYEVYSTDLAYAKFGPFYNYVYSSYYYITLAFDIILILKASIKNTSIISVQTILIITSILIPLFINIAGTMNIIPISIYVTPISFSVTVILLRNCNI